MESPPPPPPPPPLPPLLPLDQKMDKAKNVESQAEQKEKNKEKEKKKVDTSGLSAFIGALLRPAPKSLINKKAGILENVNLNLQKLTVLTYNVWFSDYMFDVRVEYILKLILDNNPDIVCLQEVIPEFVRNHVVKHEQIRKTYKFISDLTGESVNPYGVLLLSRFPMAKLQEVELDTGMGRKFLLGDFMINGSLVGIGTVHLESLGTAPLRAAQLRTIAATLSKGYDHWIVMGDFNFDSEINFAHGLPPLENDVMKEIIPNATDTWLFVNKDKSSGKTFDSEINKMLRKYERMRYDRVMLQSTSNPANPGVWIPTQARMIGTESIALANLYAAPWEPAGTWPSDHFGVFVEFTFDKEKGK